MLRRLALVLLVVPTGCKGSRGGAMPDAAPWEPACDLETEAGCEDGFVCEDVVEYSGTCFAPLLVRGAVLDAADDSPIEGARVLVLSEYGDELSRVGVTDAAGKYEITLPAYRQPTGSLAIHGIRLNADASGYQSFPGGVRGTFPIDDDEAIREGDGDAAPWVIETPRTVIHLVGLDAGAGTASIRGTVGLVGKGQRVQVVAESDGHGHGALADRDGAYEILNLPAGEYDVVAYAPGVQFERVQVSVGDGDEVAAHIAIEGETEATLTGYLDMSNLTLEDTTTIVLVVASMSDDDLVRGDSMSRVSRFLALGPGVEGVFDFYRVPEGEFVVLPGFGNDSLVRDPDPCTGGGELVTVTATGSDTVLDDTLPLARSMEILAPAGDEPRAMDDTPAFSWEADAAAEAYDVTVVDSFGMAVWQERFLDLPGDPVSVTYGGPPLEPGMYYQLRVVSVRAVGDVPECMSSQTEDLKGTFYVDQS